MAQEDDKKPPQQPSAQRGFAAMDQKKHREIASKGGQSVPPEKRSFSQNPDLAAQAGRKGGENVPKSERSFSRNRELAVQAGRKGGRSSHNRNAAPDETPGDDVGPTSKMGPASVPLPDTQ